MGLSMEIYGTLGPACDDEEILREMLACGITGMRLNLSHVTLEESRDLIGKFQRAAAEEGVKADLLVDLQGPEMRLGKGVNIEVTAGESVRMSRVRESTESGTVVVVPEEVLRAADVGDHILIDDGKLEFCVTDKSLADCEIILTATCESSGVIRSRKSIAIRNKSVTGAVLTTQDLENLKNAKRYGVTAVMQPFVRSAKDLVEVHKVLDAYGCSDVRLYAKIENLEGVQNLQEIMPHADVLVIARGDLGNAVPLWELPVLQREISDCCRKENKPFLVVTQMLSSMENSPVPTRAEVSDIFRAVSEGASAVMVTGETASGRFPVEVAKYFVNTVNSALNWKNHQ